MNSFFYEAMQASRLSGCLKVQVGAAIAQGDKIVSLGFNDAGPVEPYCPRKDMPTGTGYYLCHTHCSQKHHAETMAIYAALRDRKKERLKDSDVYIYGHNQCCEQCREAMKYYGIKRVYLMKSEDTEVILEIL